ncbi:MAG: class I SAM-dependent methyltransferase [bacterium]
MKPNRKTDHGFREIKLLMRKKLLKNINPGNALDLYAGEGKLLTAMAPAFNSVEAVEKDPVKFMKLERAVRRENLENVRLHFTDNSRFVKSRLPELSAINYIDLDAYGCPNRLIQQLFQNWTPPGRAVFAVTDGGRIYLSCGNRVKLGDYFPEEEQPKEAARIRPALIRDYELLLKSFWKSLGRRHGFCIVDWLSAWRKSRRVIYYGVCIEPD